VWILLLVFPLFVSFNQILFLFFFLFHHLIWKEKMVIDGDMVCVHSEINFGVVLKNNINYICEQDYFVTNKSNPCVHDA
jgi:hypothetical protein